jgi:GntR family transcriptional regulator / MocR family aminotransferase
VTRNWSTFGLDLYVEIDLAAGRRVGLERAMRAAVCDGRLAPGSRLPSTRALAAELGLARGTVSAAYDQLIAEGYLTARRGSGTAVADLPTQPSATAEPTPVDVTPQHDLRPGLPDVAAFPTAAWLRSTRRVLTTAPSGVYGTCDPQGRIELRTALAHYLGRTRGVAATPDRIVITSGFYQAIGLLAGVLCDTRTTVIAMEDPGHDLYRVVVRRAGLTVVPLPVDHRGARIHRLSGAEVGAVVVTPAHQYPTGAVLHPRRRHALRDWAWASGGLVIEDDYDGEYRYDRHSVGALQGLTPDHVAYLGTASKTLGPALRLGWMVLPPRLVGPVAEAKRHADLYTEALGQLILADLIATHGYDRHIRASRLRYRRRRDLLLARLGPGPDQPLPGMAVHGVAAGLHALITLPAGGPSEREVLTACTREGIGVRGLAELWHTRGEHPHGILVGYAAPTEHAYPAALDALASLLTNFDRETKRRPVI